MNNIAIAVIAIVMWVIISAIIDALKQTKDYTDNE
jgi:hypothetical protein